MAALRLASVQWSPALDSAWAEAPPGVTAAALSSLSALFEHDFEGGMAQILRAIRREPLNPIHHLRKALLLARFGDLAGASAVLDRLKQKLPDVPIVDYLRALFALRGGSADKARGICGTLETSHPGFVHGKFLRAEVQIVLAAKAMAAERYLVSLPSGPEWESLWADLLVKLVLLHPQEGPAMAQKHLEKKLPKDSRAHAAVLRAMSWARATAAELSRHVTAEPPGSHGETLVLECLIGALRSEPNRKALDTLDGLRRAYPERVSAGRLCDAYLTRAAAELSAAGKNEEALRLVERCLRDQPYDAVHYQNRAAIFTLLRENGPYHEAWSALNTHQYRLALLGACDEHSLTQIAKTHRLFAQQAYGASGQDRSARGIFRFTAGDDGEKPRLIANIDEIAADPELLRQWIHHTRAELVFRHALMGEDGRRALLDPDDRDDAAVRAAALDVLGESLRVLVPEEGSELAGILSKRWHDLASSVHTQYETPVKPIPAIKEGTDSKDSPAEDEPESGRAAEKDLVGGKEVARLRDDHLQTLADLCLICLQWRPAFGQSGVAEELLEFAHAEVPFLDNRLFRTAEKQARHETTWSVQVLLGRIRKAAGVEKKGPVTPDQRRQGVESCLAELLREMAWSAYGGNAGDAPARAGKALSFVDRARSLNPANADIELTAANLLAMGEYFDDARKALERFRRLVDPENTQTVEQADKVAELLREKRKEGKAGERRARTADSDTGSGGGEFRIRELERDLERAPSSWKSYEELVRELAMAGRYDQAIQWADRSVAQCLSRADQMNARGLAIEARGMKSLFESSPKAAGLYVLGAHDPARRAIQGVAETRRIDYTLMYLLGRCELALGLPNEACNNFREAERICDRQLHRTVLRALAENIDSAYLAVARTAVNAALGEGLVEAALDRAAAVFPRLQAPEAWLVETARVYYMVAHNRVGVSSAASPPLAVQVEAPWQNRLATALSAATDADRALALAELAAELHPPSAKAAQLLEERTKGLKRQIAAGEALNRAGTLLSEKNFAACLGSLDALDPSIAAEPRLLRVRALALLGLGRFDDADAAIQQIGYEGSPEVRAFVAHYPSLVFRRRLDAVQELLRQAKPAEAGAILAGAVASDPKEQTDLTYCRAFAAALEGYEFRRNGDPDRARLRFRAALDLIEPHLGRSAESEQRHMSELYDKLDKEVDSYART